jgi:hypothetical protein
VEVLLKRGQADNELTRYRYDVVLHIDRPTAAVEEEVDWVSHGSSLINLAQDLGQKRPAAVRLKNVPNLRLARDLAIKRLADHLDDGCNVADLRRELNQHDAVGEHPDAFHSLAEAWGYEAQISWSSSDCDGSFDVVLADRARGDAVYASRPSGAARLKSWGAYGTTPSVALLKQHLIPKLRELLRRRLPDYMVPGAFVILDALPLTPNGKIDRKSLPALQAKRPDLPGEYMVPRTAIEVMLAAVWREILNLDRVGIYDNVFDLGAHSLIIVKAHSRIRGLVMKPLSIVDMFHHPTISALAQFLIDGAEPLANVADAAAYDRVRHRREALARIRAQRRGESL